MQAQHMLQQQTKQFMTVSVTTACVQLQVLSGENQGCESTMPRTTDPYALIWEFGGAKVWDYDPKDGSIFCKLCSTSCQAKRCCTIIQQVGSMKHKAKMVLMRQENLWRNNSTSSSLRSPPQPLSLLLTWPSSSSPPMFLCTSWSIQSGSGSLRSIARRLYQTAAP